MPQLKGLRALEDVIIWIDIGPEEDLPSPPNLYVFLCRKTMDSYEDVDNLDVLHSYHSWMISRRTEIEIQTARSAFVWFNRVLYNRSQERLSKLEACQRYFPSCNVITLPELTQYEARMSKYLSLGVFVLDSVYEGNGGYNASGCSSLLSKKRK